MMHSPDDIKERLAKLQRTARRDRPALYGQTPVYRLRPRIMEEPIQPCRDCRLKPCEICCHPAEPRHFYP